MPSPIAACRYGRRLLRNRQSDMMGNYSSGKQSRRIPLAVTSCHVSRGQNTNSKSWMSKEVCFSITVILLNSMCACHVCWWDETQRDVCSVKSIPVGTILSSNARITSPGSNPYFSAAPPFMMMGRRTPGLYDVFM